MFGYIYTIILIDILSDVKKMLNLAFSSSHKYN